MAELINQTKDKIKNKIEVIKKVKDDPKSSANSFLEGKLKDLPSIQGGQLSKKISDLQSKIKKNPQNKTDIFKDLVDLVESFIGTTKKIEPSNKMFSKQRIRQITQESINDTVKNTKSIVLNSAQKILFAGDGICGSDKSLPDTVSIKPKEIDFMGVLTVSPTSNVGQIVYESNNTTNEIKMNTELYNVFTGTTYTFTSSNNNQLFTMNWDDTNQEYNITGLSNDSKKVGEFLSDYYSSIEFVDISGITKNAVMMTINPDSSSTPLFDKGMNDLNRLLSKILCFCNSSNQQNGLNQNAINQFTENDTDDEYFFDFEDLEGIDLDDESRRLQKVLKFNDCGDIEVPVRNEHFEDFVYLSKENLDKSVDNVLENTALSAFQDSGETFNSDNFYLNLITNFITNLPKALISAILSPKYFLPLVIIYKSVILNVGEIIDDAKTIMKNLSKLFKEIITQVFWKFITSFWSKVKNDLLIFLRQTALNIIKKKQRRLLSIVSSLIQLLTKLLQTNLPDCNSLYSVINKSIDLALSGNGPNIPIPPPLLLAAKLRGGYSTDRAIIDILDNVQGKGNPLININPINGNRNPILDLVSSVIEGHDNEFKNNNTIKAFTIPGTTETMGIVI